MSHVELHCPTSIQLRKRIKAGRTNRCYKALYDNTTVFVKFNDNAQEAILLKEAEMLRYLKERNINVPSVLYGDANCLVLEYHNLAISNKYMTQLAHVIGKLHGGNPSNTCGFSMNNYHGPLACKNSWNPNWVEFFQESRIKPLIKLLEDRSMHETSGLLSSVCNKMPIFFQNVDLFVCLLHGDFHQNNWGWSEASEQIFLFDPLPLYGHNEYELASFDCFVLPKPDFLEVYFSYVPKQEYMFEARRLVYHSFFCVIGYLLSTERELLNRGHQYMHTLLTY